MTAQVQKLLHSFEHLSNNEQWEFAFEILQRTRNFDFPPLQDDDFVYVAETLFLALDHEESANDASQTR
jgi:hypothetical protein